MARIFNHTFRKTGEWFGATERTVYEWSTGRGRQYDRSELTVSEGSAAIIEQPPKGTVGALEVVVRWSYGWFGRVEYTLQAYDEAIPVENEGLSRTLTSRLRAHSGAWFGESGVDRIPFKIPAGFDVREVSISRQNGNVSIANRGALIGATQSIEVEVNWSYGWNGRAAYFVTVLLGSTTLSLSISDLSITPNPGVPLQAVELNYTITNDGAVRINSISEIIEILLAVSDDLRVMSQPESARTNEIMDEITLNLQPGNRRNRDTSIVIPEFAFEPLGISSVGTYRITLRLEMGGVPLAEAVIDPFQVVPA